MERIVERPGALDVHRASVTACARVWHERKLTEHVAEFQTTVQGLLALRDWLEALQVRRVAMEATGVYWKPVWAVLEDRFELMLVNARHVKQVPGRKTDVKDAQWLCRLLEAGLLRASLVPPKPIRTLRNLTRYRKTQINDRQREAARLHKILEDSGIKLGCVASDILGKSGRDMLDALVAGTTDPLVLAELARGQLRKKIPALQAALEGRFDTEHALIVGQILAHIDFLDEAIERLSDAIEQQIAPFARQRDLLITIPGVKQRTAEVLIAEIGGMRSRPPNTSRHGPACAPATTNPPASAARARRARAPSGCAPRSPKPRSPRPKPRTPTSPPNTSAYAAGEDTPRP
jgi:transposase